jgi:hypothetical protein
MGDHPLASLTLQAQKREAGIPTSRDRLQHVSYHYQPTKKNIEFRFLFSILNF